MSFRNSLSLICFIGYLHAGEYRQCTGKGGCCEGYRFDSDQKKCIKCMDGYSGPDCMYPCPYDGYGFKCQFTCDCAESLCNVTFGCPSDSSTEIQSSPFSSTVTADVKDMKKTRDVSEKMKEFTTGSSFLTSSDSSLNNKIIFLIITFGSICALVLFAYISISIRKLKRREHQHRDSSDRHGNQYEEVDEIYTITVSQE